MCQTLESDQYQLIHRYHVGTFLFTFVDFDTENECIKPVSWPMNVFLADYYAVEERLHQSRIDAQTTVDIKSNVLLNEMENRGNRTVNDPTVEVPNTTSRLNHLSRINHIRVPKPHQPRFITETCHLSNRRENTPLLVFTINIGNRDTHDNKIVPTFYWTVVLHVTVFHN